MNNWTEQELEELRVLWWNHSPKELSAMTFSRQIDTVLDKARDMKFPRSPETQNRMLEAKKELLRVRNTTILGRVRNYENAKAAALKYTTRTEFYREDNSMYSYIRDNDLWDELCSHMAIGNFNYSEAFLHECLQDLFPGVRVIRNSRKIVPPYELDFYIPDYRIAFEYDGSAWHNTEEVLERDTMKVQKCLESGIALFRMKEHRESRQRPENFIIDALAEFGFDAHTIDKEDCISRAFNTGYTDDRIKEIVGKYTTLKDFRENEMSLYTMLCKRGLQGKYLGELDRHVADNSPENIDLALDSCSSAAEFREKHLGMYGAMKKNPEKYIEQFTKYEKLRPPGYNYDTNGKRMGRDITYNGKTQQISQWALEMGLPLRLLYKRLTAGWTVERALTEPHRKRNPR